MFRRVLTAAAVFGLLVPAAPADVVITKDGKVHGMKSEVDDVEITKDNVASYLEESTGVIVRDGYDAVEIKARERASARPIPVSEIAVKFYTNEPERLLEGLDAMSIGAYPQAIGSFQDVLAGDAREVFKDQANFYIGLCYYRSGNLPNCIAHWSQWPDKNSRWTPIVFENLAQIHTQGREFAKARALYERLGALSDLPEAVKLKAQLGDAQVDLAERKFDRAEQTAQRIAGSAGRGGHENVEALAHTVVARAILGSGAKDRLGEAETMLEKDTKVEGLDDDVRATLHVTLGDVIYTQGRPEEARYPYLRVALLFPDSPYAASALLNAGNCFLDMSGRETADPARSDALLVKGMKLLSECGGRHRGTPQAREAAKRYSEHKKRYQAITETQ